MPRFRDALDAGGFPVALEITPPRKRLEEVLLRRARLLGPLADAVNVIQRADRLSSLDASLALIAAGHEPVWHLVNKGRSRAEIAAELASAASAGVGSVLCLRGDHTAQDGPDTPRIREVVAMVHDVLPEALIGATANQYGPRERVLANLLPKLRAGATLVQTNPVFALETLRPLAVEILAHAPRTRVVPMVMPLTSRAGAERIQQRLGIPIPAALLARLERGGEVAAWADFRELLEDLVACPWAHGVAIMTPEVDPPEGTGERIAEALRAARV